MDARGFDDRLDHGVIGRGGVEDQVRHDVVERSARRLPPPAAFQLRIDGEPHRLEHGDGDLGEPASPHLAAFEPAEDRRLRPLDAHRHHHGVRLVGDQPGAVIDLHQPAGDRDAAFREDDQRFAVAHGIDQRARRHRLERIERESAAHLEERLDPPARGDADIDGEDRILGQQRHGDRRVEETHMVERDDGIRPGFVDILKTVHLQPVEQPQQHGDEIAQPARRHGAADGDGDQKRRDADQHEQHRHRDAEFLQDRHHHRRAGHEGGVKHVDRGDRARAIVDAGPGLHGGESRHDEQAAGDRKPDQIDGGANAERRRKHRGRRLRRRRRHGAESGKPEIDGEQPEQHRAGERGAEHDAPMRDTRGQSRTDADGDREHCQISRDGRLVAADQRLDQRWQQRQHDNADQPEPAGHHGAPPQPRVGAQMAEHRRGRGEDIGLTLSCGAPAPVDGMKRLAVQQASAKPITSTAKAATLPASRAASPPTMVPSRIAMKVAPSTSALAAGSSRRGKWSGRMPYLIGPNSEPNTPIAAERHEQDRHRCSAKPMNASRRRTSRRT